MITAKVIEDSDEIKNLLEALITQYDLHDRLSMCESELADIAVIGENAESFSITAHTVIASLESLVNARNLPEQANIITYGFKEKDSITFSSVTGTERLISIQRPIKRLCGEILIPAEVRIKYSGDYSDCALLAAYSCLIICFGLEIL